MKLIHYGSKKIDFRKFIPIKNNDFKPIGGLWSSPVDTKYGWKDFFQIKHDNFVIFELNKDAKILKINSLRTTNKLLKKYSLNKYPGIYFDYEKLSKDYDAIWLTSKGEDSTSYIEAFAYWDVETVLIMNSKVIIK